MSQTFNVYSNILKGCGFRTRKGVYNLIVYTNKCANHSHLYHGNANLHYFHCNYVKRHNNVISIACILSIFNKYVSPYNIPF